MALGRQGNKQEAIAELPSRLHKKQKQKKYSFCKDDRKENIMTVNMLTAADIMTQDVATIRSSATVAEAVRLKFYQRTLKYYKVC
ncbi:CBS domain-containing protein [Scytonema sp. UIC 10036]|uniref:CBS domain-containing protein n=1 Tax=Scytonema sp. UIC 10036 TaxID=2304196 RepID=UPI00140FEAB6|nr:CBS domain-containing protein [Scytonema sp. UIC 10036]